MEGRLSVSSMPTHLRVESTEVDRMYMYVDEGHNHHPTIMKDILHIRFPCLLQLNLAKNDIVSIEGMESLAMPILKELSLCKDD